MSVRACVTFWTSSIFEPLSALAFLGTGRTEHLWTRRRKLVVIGIILSDLSAVACSDGHLPQSIKIGLRQTSVNDIQLNERDILRHYRSLFDLLPEQLTFAIVVNDAMV